MGASTICGNKNIQQQEYQIRADHINNHMHRLLVVYQLCNAKGSKDIAKTYLVTIGNNLLIRA
eukprot:2820215-Ditylum_brightwellii.AAC.1